MFFKTLKRLMVVLAFLMGFLMFGSINPASAREGSTGCDVTLVFDQRFIAGSTVSEVTIQTFIPAGDYGLTFNTFDTYEDRVNTNPARQTSERVTLFGITSNDLADSVVSATGEGVGSVSFENDVTSATAIHAFAVDGIDSVSIGTACLTLTSQRVVQPPSQELTPMSTDTWCEGPTAYVKFTVTPPSEIDDKVSNSVVMEYGDTETVMNYPSDTVAAPGPGSVTFVHYSGKVVLETVVVAVAVCEPVASAPSIGFSCVGPGSSDVSVSLDYGTDFEYLIGVEVYVDGELFIQDANVEGGLDYNELSLTVTPGQTVRVVAFYTADKQTEASVTVEPCVPEVDAPEVFFVFECVSPTEVRYTVTSTDGSELTTWFGDEIANNSGIVSVGTEIFATASVSGIWSDLIWSEDASAIAPDCTPENVPEVYVSSSCTADLELREFTVTSGAGTTILSVKVDGVAYGDSGTIYPGQVVTVTAERDGVYVATVYGTFSKSMRPCELPVTGGGLNMLLGGSAAVLLGAGMLFMRSRFNRVV